MSEETKEVKYPSLYRIKCPKCDGNDYIVLGTKGATGKAMAVGAAFGAVGAIVSSAMAKENMELVPVKYKCNTCKKKFESLPLVAQEVELLTAPCKIKFKRLKSVFGMAVAQTVWLNGVKAAVVKNGETVELETNLRHNVMFVTDHYGMAFKGNYKFEALHGGNVEVNYKRKFK